MVKVKKLWVHRNRVDAHKSKRGETLCQYFSRLGKPASISRLEHTEALRIHHSPPALAREESYEVHATSRAISCKGCCRDPARTEINLAVSIAVLVASVGCRHPYKACGMLRKGWPGHERIDSISMRRAAMHVGQLGAYGELLVGGQ